MREMLWAYIKSAKAGLYITSVEETRVEADIKSIADELQFKLYSWSLTQGLICVSDDPPTRTPDTNDPVEMLEAFQKLPRRSIVLARDLHMLLGDSHSPNPMLVRKIKDAIKIGTNTNRVLITVGCRFVSIPELEKEWAVVEFKLPDKEQLRLVLNVIAKSAGIDMNENSAPILEAASGLTTQEASDAFAMSVVECNDIRAEIVAREKANTVKKNGILEIIETTLGLADIAGLDRLKPWLCKRKAAFSDAAKAFGLPTPKGILLTGVSGTGKSLSAKATSNIFQVPLLKLDVGRIFQSLVGQSEENLRTVIQTAEAVAPCILWCDEIEKAFAGSKSSGSTDGGTSARVFGTFLNWMNDKTSPVLEKCEAWIASRQNGRRYRPRILAQATHPTGYKLVTLSREGVLDQRKVHHLVLAAFVGPRPPGMECRHEGVEQVEDTPAGYTPPPDSPALPASVQGQQLPKDTTITFAVYYRSFP